MLQKKSIETTTFELLKKLMTEPILSQTRLVGGTALALQLGHRKSTDLDLFTNEQPDIEFISNTLTEIYGYKAAMKVIVMGFIMSLFVSLMAGLVTTLPAPLYEDNLFLSDSFDSLFGLAPRTAVASLLAFFAGSTVNARIMSAMKEKSGEKGFGWRAILSSLGGESVDSLIFFPMVFSGIMPFKGILSLVITQVICKTLYELVVLPLTALIVRIIKKKEQKEQYEQQ